MFSQFIQAVAWISNSVPFLRLNNILPYGQTAVCARIHPLTHVQVVWLL